MVYVGRVKGVCSSSLALPVVVVMYSSFLARGCAAGGGRTVRQGEAADSRDGWRAFSCVPRLGTNHYWNSAQSVRRSMGDEHAQCIGLSVLYNDMLCRDANVNGPQRAATAGPSEKPLFSSTFPTFLYLAS